MLSAFASACYCKYNNHDLHHIHLSNNTIHYSLPLLIYNLSPSYCLRSAYHLQYKYNVPLPLILLSHPYLYCNTLLLSYILLLTDLYLLTYLSSRFPFTPYLLLSSLSITTRHSFTNRPSFFYRPSLPPMCSYDIHFLFA